MVSGGLGEPTLATFLHPTGFQFFIYRHSIMTWRPLPLKLRREQLLKTMSGLVKPLSWHTRLVNTGPGVSPALCQFSPIDIRRKTRSWPWRSASVLPSAVTPLTCLWRGYWCSCTKRALQTQPAPPQLGVLLSLPTNPPLLRSGGSTEHQPQCDVSLTAVFRDTV